MNSSEQTPVISATSQETCSTRPPFEGLSQAIALFLEGPVSQILGVHSGYVRLEAFQQGIAYVRLGGGCEGCPSSQITLFSIVRSKLQDRFGDDVVMDVTQSLEA